MKKLLLLLGLCTGAAQAAVIVTYPYAAHRSDRAGADRCCTRAGSGSRRDRARGPSAGAAAAGAYRHHERQDAYDEINHLQQQRIDELNQLQAQRINNFNSRHPR
ncbi:hypothetical protein [Serratia marcescens]|uniref:hypothetical protein n=1 Tax=Serratia marcescens TaxID=615 RepID=UPI0021ACA161|nr:hypothetical protein [Serratia marcescens]